MKTNKPIPSYMQSQKKNQRTVTPKKSADRLAKLMSPGKSTRLGTSSTKLQNSLNNNILEKLKKERLNVLKSANKTQVKLSNQLNEFEI